MHKLTSTRVEATLILVFMMAEGNRFSCFSKIDINSILSNSAYYFTEVREDGNTSSVVFLSLPKLTEWLAYIKSEDRTLKIDSHPSKEWLGIIQVCMLEFLYIWKLLLLVAIKCSWCQPMQTAREFVLCKISDKIKTLLVSNPVSLCITTSATEFQQRMLVPTDEYIYKKLFFVQLDAYDYNHGYLLFLIIIKAFAQLKSPDNCYLLFWASSYVTLLYTTSFGNWN